MAELNATQMRDALAWVTNDQKEAKDPSKAPWEWFWEAVQGDFNEDRSTSQILVDAAVSMIPLVDQICDIRDLIANCRKLHEDKTDTWAWVALILTLIGFIPILGSLVKGVLKVFFAFIRRAGAGHVVDAVDDAMTWVITLLRRRDFQNYLRFHKIDDVFSWLAKRIKEIKSKADVNALLVAFDRGIRVTRLMAAKVAYVPVLSKRIKNLLDEMEKVRGWAREGIALAARHIDEIFDSIVRRLEHQSMLEQKGILDSGNIHFRGAIPEIDAVGLMRNPRTRPDWVTDGPRKFDEALETDYAPIVAKKKSLGWPDLTETNIKSFHKIFADEIKGPARLYRIIAPTSGAMGDCWVSEEVFHALQNSANPKAAWRRYLAVWPDWNVNGQFVIYEVRATETLKVWRGPASSQVKPSLPGLSLEGGWEQIIFKVDRSTGLNDDVQYFKIGQNNWKERGIGYGEYSKLTSVQKLKYTSLRVKINHPNISGPFDTDWGYLDFGGKGFSDKVGIPNFPGQTTTLGY